MNKMTFEINGSLFDFLSKKMIVFTSLDIFQNLLSNWELFNILDNSEELIKLLNDFELCDINSISNYFDYVILCKILSAENNLSYIKDNNNKLLIKKICDLSSQILENINNKMVIDFINSNYLSVFGTDIAVINLRSSTISLISKFIAGIKSPVFEYICKEYNYLIINNFESFYKIIVDNINLFDILFHKYSYEEVYQLRVEKVLQVWTYILNKNNCELKNKVLFLTKELCNDIVTNYEKYSSNNLLSFSKDLHELYNHLKITRNPLANEFSNVILKIENQVSEYLISNGSHFEFEIPVSDIIKRIMNMNPGAIRLLALTHDYNIDLKRYNSRLSISPKDNSSIIDDISTNITVDDYYTPSHQQTLSFQSSFCKSSIYAILSKLDTRKEIFYDFYSCAYYLQQSLPYSQEDILNDVTALLYHCNMVFDNITDDKIQYTLCYGASIFTCAFLEKILRTFYLYLKKGKIYVPLDKVVLHNLLDEKDIDLAGIFNKDHLKNLQYFLLKNGEKAVGKNYRNSLAHLYGISFSEINAMFYSEILWLFFDVFNTILFEVLSNQSFYYESAQAIQI